MFILPSGKWFKLPCFDHLFSLRTQTDKKNKNSSSENRVYFANNPIFGKKNNGEKCFTTDNLDILVFSPALVPLAAGRGRLYRIAIQHSEAPRGFVRLTSFTGQSLSRENILLLYLFCTEIFTSTATFPCSYRCLLKVLLLGGLD